MRKPPVKTDPEGRFALESERVLSVFRGAGWDRVRLSFAHAGYQDLRTNYSILPATNTPGGEPVLDAGTIWLQPVRR